MSKVRPNDPCPCGSGKKYKKCCGAGAGAAPGNPQAVLNAAFGSLDQGRFAEAVKQAGSLVAAGIRHPDVFGVLGMAHYQLGQFGEAAKAMAEVTRLVPKSAEAWANLGLMQQHARNYQAAVKSCGRALELDAHYAPAYNNLGNVFLKLGSYAEAEKNYRKAHQLEPENLLALVNLGRVLNKQGRNEEAEAALRPVVARAPEFASARSALGMVYLDQGKLDEALGELQAAAELEPGSPDFACNLGKYWQRAGDGGQAHASYHHALKLAPHHGDAYVCLAELHANDPERSERYYGQALKADPNNPAALTHAGIGMLARGRHREGEQMLQRALDEDPARGDAHAGLAFAAMRQFLHDQARMHVERAIALAPDNPYVVDMYAKYFTGRGETDKAIEACRRLLERDPDSLVAWVGLAAAYAENDDDVQTEIAFERAAEIGGEKAQVFVQWAMYEERRHRLDKAEALARQALEVSGDGHDSAYRLLARIARRDNRLEDALAAIERAEALAGPQGSTFDQSAIAFDKAAILDKLKRYPEAFDSLVRANDLQAETAGFEYQGDVDWAARYIEVLANEKAMALQPLPSAAEGPQPVFVVGFPRSGTTLMEHILGAHASVIPAGELPYIASLTETVGKRLAEATGVYPDWITALNPARSEEVFSRLRDDYLREARKHLDGADVPWFVDKMPLNQNHLWLIRLLFPASPIIHMMRHPLDSCLSAFMSNFSRGHAYSRRIDTTARYFARSARLTLWYRDHLDLNYRAVRYEELVDDQERITREVLDFVGLPWDEACLRFNESKRIARTASYAQVTQKIYTSSRYRYKNYYAQLRPVFPLIEETVRAYGYEIEPPEGG